MDTNFYAVLGIASTADDDDIRRAYRREALLWHPDKHQGPTADDANARFQDISHAYQILADPASRAQYDATLLQQQHQQQMQQQSHFEPFPFGFGPPPPPPFMDPFASFHFRAADDMFRAVFGTQHPFQMHHHPMHQHMHHHAAMGSMGAPLFPPMGPFGPPPMPPMMFGSMFSATSNPFLMSQQQQQRQQSQQHRQAATTRSSSSTSTSTSMTYNNGIWTSRTVEDNGRGTVTEKLVARNDTTGEERTEWRVNGQRVDGPPARLTGGAADETTASSSISWSSSSAQHQ
ncbi:DnaJ domain-containing protein [Blastocladiella britannica]|nr:DnaJ domain-containing protein [Blastocladiella britannica]